MRYAQIVMGPAGSGKSTYCSTLQTHGVDTHRDIQVINLDPAAEHFQYKAMADMRDLVQVHDVMEAEDLDYGPNGGLIFCMEYLMEFEGLEWLKVKKLGIIEAGVEQLGDSDDDYILFDCPGQIELYTHMDIFKRFVKQLTEWDFRVCAVFILDSHYMVDGAKFLSGSLTALSTMIKLELPQINVLSKMDLLNKEARKNLEMFLEPDVHELLASEHSVSRFNKKYHKLTLALGRVLDEYSLVKFVPLNINKEESINDLLLQIDFSIQYGEDKDVKTKDFEYPDPEDREEEEDFFQIN